MVDKQRRWIPLDTQPSEENAVAITSYYSTLKADSNYRKRVSWLEGNRGVAVYVYQAELPKVNQPHGGTLNTDGEYVCGDLQCSGRPPHRPHCMYYSLLPYTWSVSERLLNTSAHIRPFSAIYGVYNRHYS